jgi:glucose-1-phosphate adenylyltransferase
MRNVACLVLGGGKGTRLFPLTGYRSKPAVPLAAKYRLIDIPISNCINSGINRIYVLTQFNSVSLHRHIRQTYSFDRFDGGFVEILAAQQTMGGGDWYEGTADAVRKQMRYIQQPWVKYVLVVSGDQLYRMDYCKMLKMHQETGADASIAAVPVTSEAAAAFGIMRIDDAGRVVGFLEKPKTEDELKLIRTDPAWLDAHGVDSRGRDCLASMGIYLFNRDTLVDLLTKSDYEDFGKEIFPMAIRTRPVQMYPFDGYWEDIGTIRAFYDANLALAGETPPFELATDVAPIYSRPRFLPPTRIAGAQVTGSLIADGCLIGAGAVIENSVIGLRCRIGKNVTIRNSFLMGNDYYQDDREWAGHSPEGAPEIGIGSGTLIEGALIDKNCRIGENTKITLAGKDMVEADLEHCYVRDGIIVVPKEEVIPNGADVATSGPRK